MSKLEKKIQICACVFTFSLKWYYDKKSPYLFFLHFESMIYNYLPCQILGHEFNEKSEFLDFELSIKLPAITQLKNGRVQKTVGSFVVCFLSTLALEKIMPSSCCVV